MSVMSSNCCVHSCRFSQAELCSIKRSVWSDTEVSSSSSSAPSTSMHALINVEKNLRMSPWRSLFFTFSAAIISSVSRLCSEKNLITCWWSKGTFFNHQCHQFLIYCSKTEMHFYFAILFRAWNILRCTSTQLCQTPCSMQHHTVPRIQQCPNSPLAFHVLKLKPKQIHLERVGETFSKQSKYPCKCAWVVLGTQAGVGCDPNACDSQPDPVHAWEILGSYWFWTRTHPLLMCMSTSHKIPSDCTFFLTRRVLKSWTLTCSNCKMKYDELDS